MARVVSRLSALDGWSRPSGGGGAAGLPGEALHRPPGAPGIAQGWDGPSQVDPRADTGQRGWVEDRLLAELSDRLLPPSLQPLSPMAYAEALRTAIDQLSRDDGTLPPGGALSVLKVAVANEDAVHQGRYALQGV